MQGYVSALRDALGDSRIETLERGYALRVDPGEVDADRLEAAVRAVADVRAGAGARAPARSHFGPSADEPLEDLRREPWAEREAAHLDELVLAALEARIDAELELGAHRRLVPELERLVEQHPYREHLLEQLMLALYRAGRQADALEVYRRGTMRLARRPRPRAEPEPAGARAGDPQPRLDARRAANRAGEARCRCGDDSAGS